MRSLETIAQPIKDFFQKGPIMNWRANILETLGNVARFLAVILFIFDGILVAGFSTWFTLKFLSKAIDYLNHTLFSPHGWY
jgi:type IV secretory pathway VirB2 component (pilin)